LFRSSAWSQNQACVGDQETVTVDQGIVDGDDSLVAVAGRGVFLKFVETSLIESLDVPYSVGQKPIEAGLVGSLCELTVDSQHGLSLGDDQTGEILGEMSALALVGEEFAVLSQGLLDNLGKLNDPWHDQVLLTPFAPGEN
jgi:hypothetical protein